ncbi:MAG: EamA family transporter, partial [Burkholderiaceae bacterium]
MRHATDKVDRPAHNRHPHTDLPVATPTMMRQPGGILAAIGFTVAACGLFALLDTATKYAVQTVPVLMVLCVRYLVQALVSSAWLMPTYGRVVWQMQRPRLLFLRGLLLVSSTILAILSLRVMPVADFAGIVMVTPVVVTVVSATVFREPVGRWQWVCVGLGFVGAMLIIQPGGARFNWGTLLPLGCMAASV